MSVLLIPASKRLYSVSGRAALVSISRVSQFQQRQLHNLSSSKSLTVATTTTSSPLSSLPFSLLCTPFFGTTTPQRRSLSAAAENIVASKKEEPVSTLPPPTEVTTTETIVVPGDTATLSLLNGFRGEALVLLGKQNGCEIREDEVEVHKGKSKQLSIISTDKQNILAAKSTILDIVSGKLPALQSKAYREMREKQALAAVKEKELDDEEIFKLQEEGKMVYKEQIPFVRCIAEIIATKTPREIAEEKLIDEQELEVQFRKYELWLRHLRRKIIRTRKGKVKKRRRRLLKQRVKERNALYEIQYWQHWKVGDVAYQGYA